MEENKMKKHVTIVGAIHIGFGFLGLIGAMAIFFAFNFARGFIPPEEGDIPITILKALGIGLTILVGFMSTLGLIGGIGLIALQSWARYLIIVVAILGLLNIPIGTLKGVYSLWVLFQDDTVKLWQGKQ